MVRLFVRLAITSFTFLLSIVALSQDPDSIISNRHDEFLPLLPQQPADTAEKGLSIIFAGDIMGHDAQINGAYEPDSNRYNYEPVFRFVRDYISKADVAVANLEVTLAGPPYKGYPEFSSPDELAIAARDAGFDVFVQANNHALDRGANGFVRTIKVLDSLAILHTGTFLTDSARNANYPLILEKNDIRIALLNYTYGTNGIKIVPPLVINMIDTSLIKKDIQKAKLYDPDFTIVTIHWGNEYEIYENETQRDLADFITKAGADLIIGSHPHVVQPVKKIYSADSGRSNIVVYSLGNFVSNQRDRYRDGGIIFGITLEKTDGNIHLKDFSYLPYWVYRESRPERSLFYVLPVSLYENNPEIINLGVDDKIKLEQFAGDTRSRVTGVPESSFYQTKD